MLKGTSKEKQMPRANRYFLPGHVWHITHRSHQRKFFLKFARDRRRYLRWLLESKKRFGLSVLNYMELVVTIQPHPPFGQSLWPGGRSKFQGSSVQSQIRTGNFDVSGILETSKRRAH